MLDPESQGTDSTHHSGESLNDSGIQRQKSTASTKQDNSTQYDRNQIDLSDESIQRESGTQHEGPTVESFRQVSSYEDLVNLYAQHGHSFDSPEALFQQVKEDWLKERLRLYEDTIDNPLPDEFPSCSVAVNGQKHTILGCMHTPAVGQEYYRLLLTALGKSPWWTHEQNLGSAGMFIPGLEQMSLEIDDHNVRGIGRRIMKDYLSMWTMPVKSIKFALFSKRIADTAVKQGRSKHAFFEQFLNMPFDTPMDMPSHIDIIRREKLDLGYTLTQVRSAYQAAFFKAWNPEQAHEARGGTLNRSNFPEESWNEKNILVGAAHAHEIEYFLTHEPKFEKTAIERARKDAELYNKDPAALYRRRQLRDAAQKMASIGLSIGTGYGAVTLLFEGAKLFS